MASYVEQSLLPRIDQYGQEDDHRKDLEELVAEYDIIELLEGLLFTVILSYAKVAMLQQ